MGYRISRWADDYEPDKQPRNNGPLKFVKCYVHAGDQSASMRNLICLASTSPMFAGCNARDAFCLFIKLLELAANHPRGKRDGTIWSGDKPATIDQMVRSLWPMFDRPTLESAIQLLCHEDVAWIEEVCDQSVTELQQACGNGATESPSAGGTPATELPQLGHIPVAPTEPNRTELNLTQQKTGTGASDPREDDRAGPDREPAQVPDRLPRDPTERRNRIESTIRRFDARRPEVWLLKACELLAQLAGLDAAGRSAQGEAIAATFRQIQEHPRRDAIAAELIDLALSKLRCRNLRSPWAAWQAGTRKVLQKLETAHAA